MSYEIKRQTTIIFLKPTTRNFSYMDPKMLNELITMKMPYGKYKGWTLSALPEPYLVWYHSKGFPAGRLGHLLATMYEIKLNGLEYLLQGLKK